MSEIKFACPHCAQHIACSDEYADLIIACPACGHAMLVPILSASDTAPSVLVVVASAPTPRRTISSRVPKLDPWTEECWEEHSGATTAGPPEQSQYWVVSSLATVILAAVLRATGLGLTTVTVVVIAGALLSGYLMWKGGGGFAESGPILSAIGGGLMASLLVIVLIPLIAFSVLLAGCAACH